MSQIDPGEPDRVALQARDVAFDWAQLPMHWIPGEPFATHMINFLHLVLPEGERWFVEVFKQAMPLIEDDRLLEDVRGFVGQEAMHAESHQGVLDHFDAHGLDTRPYVAQVGWMFRKILGDRPHTGKRAESWLVQRLAMIAAIEHYTAFLGQWVLDAEALDAAGADPTMLDLLRWHGAEEVEHRSVAYDLYMHVDGGYLQRCRTMAIAITVLAILWARGVRFLMAHDPVLRGRRKPRFRDMLRTGRLGLTPSYWQMLRAIPPYFRRSYHPSQHGSTSQAVAYLAKSPAAQAAEH
ncbi:metal-dependent hydrolase [Saccharopolyspora shandongensis]|uniref:metal-dependent hydrolase n=1 Tax=Saccharopolyspora shandongensis TaxID=418495 RepID=UPI0033C0CAF3